MTAASSQRNDDLSLAAIRRQIEALAVPDGRFRVACAASGHSPVPVDGRSFPDRETATVAADLARMYRSRLRCRDHRTPVYELIVHEGPTPLTVPTDCAVAFDAAIIDADADTIT